MITNTGTVLAVLGNSSGQHPPVPPTPITVGDVLANSPANTSGGPPTRAAVGHVLANSPGQHGQHPETSGQHTGRCWDLLGSRPTDTSVDGAAVGHLGDANTAS